MTTLSKTVKKTKITKVKSILVSQPKPESNKSPYFDLADRYNVKVDFRPFIQVEGVPGKDFRKQKINFHDYSAVIFTSRNSVDHFFRVCEELKFKMPQSTKYFCITEAIALYLQKYILYRKRKVFFGNGKSQELMNLLLKYKDDGKYLLPCSDVHKDDYPKFLADNSFDYSEAVIYRTVYSDLSDLRDLKYDMIIFFSPSGVKSLFHNFPKFKQNGTRIAAFGPTTAGAVEEASLRLDVKAPAPQAPSMTMAIENYIKEANK